MDSLSFLYGYTIIHYYIINTVMEYKQITNVPLYFLYIFDKLKSQEREKEKIEELPYKDNKDLYLFINTV